jgi:hypothetical protein
MPAALERLLTLFLPAVTSSRRLEQLHSKIRDGRAVGLRCEFRAMLEQARVETATEEELADEAASLFALFEEAWHPNAAVAIVRTASVVVKRLHEL